ncbi:Histone acetyltransferase type B catalytic subunit [Hibiscus syriacus]|uniref:histone acetyltransferase n=1 Tax=Hibiscus syriacus TaxID=106335 RepID=A0A6A2ZA02_HIBSY|nr:histone acetyltransferase type B catalytic subunit-like [Hibiscus syriacus]KAE8688433.1 Histone acetyltransferase type B catalytic subunit [Hibiscus syriacus]
MGKKQQHPNADQLPDPKKKRRVGFSGIDAGVEPNECIKIYLVSKKEEVGTSDGFCINPVDLNGFFEEDEKIYGYQGLKITVWVNIISFHSHAEITFQGTSDGGKGITDLKSALEKIFGETLLDNKDDFLQTFSTENNFVSSVVSHGEKLQMKASNGLITNFNGNSEAASSDLEVVRLKMDNLAAGHLYSRLVPLILLLVDGSNPIDVTDPIWELYLLTQKKIDQPENAQHLLLGFAALYRFYHYPNGSRLRLSQILVLPPYQHKGYGSHLVEVLSNVAISEDVYDFTVEEPLDYFQHVRTSFDIKRLLAFEPAQEAIKSAASRLKQGKLSKKAHIPRFLPSLDIVEEVRKTLKINKKQFLQCWEILIYLGLDPIQKHMEDYVTIISNRVKADILGKDSETAGKQVIEVPSVHDEEASFVMFRSQSGEAGSVQMDEDQTKTQEQQLQQLVDERIKEVKLIAEKVSLKHV